jgi:hypothetical protein
MFGYVYGKKQSCEACRKPTFVKLPNFDLVADFGLTMERRSGKSQGRVLVKQS